MGLFSDKVKTIKGISFTPIVQDTREEFIQFKREVLKAMISNFTVKRYAYELWKYKKSVRHRYKANKLDDVSGGMQTKTFTKFDHSAVVNYLTTSGVPDVVRILRIQDRQRINSSDTSDAPSNSHRDILAIMIWDANKPSYADYTVPVGTNGEYDVYSPYPFRESYTIIDNGVTGTVMLVTYYQKRAAVAKYRLVSGIITYAGTHHSVLETGLSLAIDVKGYFYGIAWYLTTGSNHGSLPVDGHHIPLNESNPLPTETTSSFNIAPMLQVKGLNSVATPEDEQVVRQLKNFGIGIDSIQSLLDNDVVKDFKVGLMVSPHDALTSKPITKYLFNFFDGLGIPTTEEYSDVFIAQRDGFTFDQNVGGTSTYNTSFSVTKSVKSGTIPNGNQATYRLKCRQNIPNSQRFYKHIKGVYDDVIGNDGSNTKTSAELYTEIIDALEADPNNQTLIDAKRELPSPRATSSFQPIKYIVVSCVVNDYVAASVKERSDAITFGDDDAMTVIWDVIGAKEIIDFADADKYSAIASSGYEYNELYEDYLNTGNTDGEPIEVFSIELNYQHAANAYTVISYSNGKIVYTTDSGEITQRHTEEDTNLRIPMIREALQGVSIYEFHELYSKCFTGLAFTVQKVRIKWYQRGIFKTILQIVLIIIAIVIAYFSAGSAATVSGAIISVAMNLAVGYALTVLVTAVLDAAGIDTTWVSVVVAVVQMYYTGTVTSDGMIQLGFAIADTAIKLELQSTKEDMERLQNQQKEFNRMMDKKMKELKDKLELYNGDIFNLVKQSPEYDEMMLYSPSYSVEVSEGLLEVREQTEWKLPQVTQVDFNQTDNLGRGWFDTTDQFTKNLRIGEIHTFGVGRFQ